MGLSLTKYKTKDLERAKSAVDNRSEEKLEHLVRNQAIALHGTHETKGHVEEH